MKLSVASVHVQGEDQGTFIVHDGIECRIRWTERWYLCCGGGGKPASMKNSSGGGSIKRSVVETRPSDLGLIRLCTKEATPSVVPRRDSFIAIDACLSRVYVQERPKGMTISV